MRSIHRSTTGDDLAHAKSALLDGDATGASRVAGILSRPLPLALGGFLAGCVVGQYCGADYWREAHCAS